jgi:hypothetical protein
LRILGSFETLDKVWGGSRYEVRGGDGDGAGAVLRGEIGREGFASGMQGTGIREQAKAVREGFTSEWLPPFMR